MVRIVVVGAVVVLAACSDEASITRPDDVPPAFAANGVDQLQDRYIVVFRDDVPNPDALIDQVSRGAGAQVHYRYRYAIKGFAATIPPAAIEGIRRNPNVTLVEPDGIVTTLATQNNATWGLDRIDQRNLPLSGTYTYDVSGGGVRAYIIDTGIHYSHNEFGVRASFGYDALGGDGSDCNGHGTHVAGTVGGTVYGVAKNVTLYAVRVLNCSGSGTTSGVIAGVDWVRNNAIKPAVANMSLGGGASTSLDNAVSNAIASGVTFAVAAGNSSANACNYSPARVASALTVGSTTSSDSRSSFSNFGSCVDLFAPGSGITSAWRTSNTATNTISGTSMASPHVAGVAALYLSISGHSGASPTTVASALINNATAGVVGNAGSGSPNRLLHSRFGSSPPDDDDPSGTAIGNLTGSTTASGPNWTATVTVLVVNGSSPVSGATVTGSFSTGGGSGTCTTNGAGTCSFSTDSMHKRNGSTTFTVTQLNGTSYSGPNASITISKP